ncbi:uncharacterized protein ABDE67_007168 [Symphorus nematophorus]
MTFLRNTLCLLVLFVVFDCSWAEEKDLSVSELLWRANKDVVHTEEEPFVMDDIAYDNENERNADPCTSQGCMWGKSGDGKVYVPYVIASHYSSRERSIIERGLVSFNDVSCIRFVQRTNQRDYLSIQSHNGCYSYVGRRGYSQTLSLDRQGCLYHSTVQHELLHALGFNHEQCRSDRDQYIRVLWQNIQPGLEYAFDKINTLNQNTPYDYNSVMQYHRYAFSANNRPTMEPIPNPNVEFGTSNQMSQNDILRLNRLYRCAVKQAHRIGKKSDRPRPLIAKFLNFRDKEKALRLARSKGEMTYENKKISFYPDYRADLQRRRDEFRDVKRALREKEVEYALIFPAKLRIKHQGSVKFFSTPAEAQLFLKELPMHSPDEPFIEDDVAYDSEAERNADPCTARGCMWPKSADGKVYVPYTISNVFSSREVSIIERGLQSFHDVSCIHLVRRTSQRDYLKIQSLNGCYSYIGRRNYGQDLSLQRSGCVYYDTVQHEVLHALGFHHEQKRSDRDQYIRILLENVTPGWEYAFDKINTLNQGTPYDYNSVMQYSKYAFSKNNQPTMLPIPDPNVPFGTATEMSQNDITRLNRLYNCR